MALEVMTVDDDPEAARQYRRDRLVLMHRLNLANRVGDTESAERLRRELLRQRLRLVPGRKESP